MKNKRILLCNLRGGVNDTFSQASKVIRYGLEYKRIMYFQTIDSVFKGKFNEIFSLINTKYRIFFDELPDELKFFLTKKKKYTKYRNVIYSDSGFPVTFDFEKDHVDDILCHDQFGGGSNGYEFLKYFEPKDIIKNKIKDFQNKYKNQYDGIHIRCTDIQTDYKKNFQKLMTKNFNYIFVCSDSDDVLVHANQIIPKRKLLYSSIFRSKTLKNLHIESDFSERECISQLILTFYEIYILAGCKTFYYCRSRFGLISGFSQLILGIRNYHYKNDSNILLNDSYALLYFAKIQYKLNITIQKLFNLKHRLHIKFFS